MTRARMPRVAALALIALLPLLAACGDSKDDDKEASGPTGPVEELYNNGVDALNAKRWSSATDQFNAVEQNYPYSSWAVNAQLMQGYSQYLQNKYTDAIGTLDRFIQLHPGSGSAAAHPCKRPSVAQAEKAALSR